MKDFEDSLELLYGSASASVQQSLDLPVWELKQLDSQAESSIAEQNHSTHINTSFFKNQEYLWQELSSATTEFAQLLGLFADDAIHWDLIERTAQHLQWSEQQIDEARVELFNCHWLSFTDEGLYKVDPQTHQFLKTKLAQSERVEASKQAFATVMVHFVQQMPLSPTAEQRQALAVAIPHLEKVAHEATHYLKNEDLYLVLTTLAHFYADSGTSSLAKDWYEQCLLLIQFELGDNHAITIACLNNLAGFYHSQNSYEEAELLYTQALERSQEIGDFSTLATTLNNLASIYKLQGDYERGEACYLQALELKQGLLGERHPSIATSLNNLAGIYYAQKRYQEAEVFYKKALQLKKCLLGTENPRLATNLNNLASVYHAQKRYQEAESLYVQAVKLGTKLWGENHPDTLRFQRNLQIVRDEIAVNPKIIAHSLIQQLTQKITAGARHLLAR